MKYKLIIIALLMFSLVGFVSAEAPTYHTVEKNFAFVSSAVKDAQVLQSFTIDIPGGYSSIESFTLEFVGDYAGATIYGILNTSDGIKYCNPNGWVTPNSNGYKTKFDCTTIADNHTKKEKETSSTFRGLVSFNGLGFETDKAVNNVYGTIKITYLDKGSPQIEVHGTEYTQNIGQTAKVWLQLINASGEHVNDGACLIHIRSPSDEEVIENGAMISANHDGIYYYDIGVDALDSGAEGVYPVVVECSYTVNETIETSDAFTLTTGVVDDKTYLVTDVTDGSEHKIKQVAGAFDFYYDFNDMCGVTTPENLLSGLSIHTNVKWVDSVAGDNVIMSIYNYTSSSWIDLPNQIIEPNNRIDVSNFVESNNLTRDGLVSAGNQSRIRYRDNASLGTDDKIEVDMVQIHCDEHTTFDWIEAKGSSEIHLTPNVWSDDYIPLENRTATINNTLLVNDFWNYSGNVSSSLLDKLATSFWTYVARYTHGVSLV